MHAWDGRDPEGEWQRLPQKCTRPVAQRTSHVAGTVPAERHGVAVDHARQVRLHPTIIAAAGKRGDAPRLVSVQDEEHEA
jgi:hypothetical protein